MSFDWGVFAKKALGAFCFKGKRNASEVLTGGALLRVAARIGDLVVLESLIDAGADVDDRSVAGMSAGTTALMAAAGEGHAGCVKLLLEAAASVDLSDADGLTALMQASQEGHVECVELLMEAGASVGLRDVDGLTAVMHAAQEGYAKCVERLIGAGAAVDLIDGDGWTALMHASSGGSADCVVELLKAGAGAAIEELDSALKIAERRERAACVEALSAELERRELQGAVPVAGKEGDSLRI